MSTETVPSKLEVLRHTLREIRGYLEQCISYNYSIKCLIYAQTRVAKIGNKLLFCASHLAPKRYTTKLPHLTTNVQTHKTHAPRNIIDTSPSLPSAEGQPLKMEPLSAIHIIKIVAYKHQHLRTSVYRWYRGICFALPKIESSIVSLVDVLYLLDITVLAQD